MSLVAAIVAVTGIVAFSLLIVAKAKNAAASPELQNLEDLEQMRALGARKRPLPLGQHAELDYLSRGAHHSG